MKKIIYLIIIPILFGCTKYETWEPGEGYLDILNDEIYIQYDTTKESSYYIVNYNAAPLSRIYWSSIDSFISLKIGDIIEKVPVVDYSTYTRDDSTGCQVIYYNKSHIGTTLDIYAKCGNLNDTLLIHIQ